MFSKMAKTVIDSTRWVAFAFLGIALLGNALGQAAAVGGEATSQTVKAEDVDDEVIELPPFVLSDKRVANQEVASTYSSAVSLLRFEPQVDLQSRNFGEAQGDIAIRGGIFEGTALRVGGLTLFDPQTGHYTAEVPIPVEMLSAPVVRTGVDHALGSMQAAVGTLDYGWRRIATGGSMSAVAVCRQDLAG